MYTKYDEQYVVAPLPKWHMLMPMRYAIYFMCAVICVWPEYYTLNFQFENDVLMYAEIHNNIYKYIYTEIKLISNLIAI